MTYSGADPPTGKLPTAVLGTAPVARRSKKSQELTFGERLRRIRREKHLTQKDLAKKLGNDDAVYISRLEVGTIASPGLERVHRLAEALDVAVSELTGEAGGDVERAIVSSELDDEAKRSLIRMYRALKRER